MLRRTNSNTHIPVPKHEFRPRSKSSVRPSLKDAPSSSKKSTDRLAPAAFKRSTSTSSLFRKSALTTPTQRSSGFKRSGSNLVTPSSSSRSRSKSPFKLGSAKSERHVNDKKWVSEQFSKVRRYLHEHISCEKHIPDTLKPPTINTFVYVINLLLKEIDPQIIVNTTNYKETVLNIMKTLHYPGNISNSLLKTVNTMHAWPQVISIFAWLVDLITIIKRVKPVDPALEEDPKYKQIECITDYIIARYLLYNNNEDQQIADKEFGENFVKILNIDEKENKKLGEEVRKLSLLKENQEKQITEKSNRNDEIKRQIDDLKSKIDEYYGIREQRQDHLNDDISALKARRDKLAGLIKTKKQSITNLQETIQKQPCTLKEKKKMEKHIDELKHSIDLRKEKNASDKAIKENCEIKFCRAKKLVETEVYRLNADGRKLALLEPELRILNLKNTNFLSADFGNEVQTLNANIKMFGNKFRDEIAELKSTLSQMKKENLLLEQQVESSKEAIQGLTETQHSLSNQIENYNDEIKKLHKRRADEKLKFEQNMKKLAESAPNIDEVRQKLEELKETKRKKESDFELLKKHSVEFFVKLSDKIKGNLVNMNNIRSEVFDMLKESLSKVEEVQNTILEDLHELDEIMNNGD